MAAEVPSLLDIADASLDSEAIRTDAFNLQERRKQARFRELAEQVYGEDSAELLAFDEQANLVMARSLRGGDVDAEFERIVSGPMFERIREMNEAGTGTAANLPKTFDEFLASVEAEVEAELAAADRTLANREEGVLEAGAEFGGGSVGGLTGYDVPLAFLGGTGTLVRKVAIEAGLGVAGEAASIPDQQRVAEQFDLGPVDVQNQLLFAGAFAGGLPIAGRAITGGGRQLGQAVSNSELVKRYRKRASTLSPEARGAGDILNNQEVLRENRPAGVDPGDFEADAATADAAIRFDRPWNLPEDPAPPEEAVRPRTYTPPKSDVTHRIVGAESSGRADAANPDSTALGAGQFIESTWLDVMQRYRPDLTEGKTREQILAMRLDKDLSVEMTARYAEQGRAFLGRNGLPIHDGAVYLHHFAGPGGAKAALEADPATPIGKVLTKGQISANAGITYDGKRFSEWTAGDLVNWSRSKMGLATGNIDDYPMVTQIFTFDPMTIRTDAETFQYKLEADAEGVTDRLLGETIWDREAALGVVVYERADGVRFIADGHQRSGLARRLTAGGQTGIELEGFLYREADGWTPEMVRVKAALKNIRAETGSALDAAKIIRDHPELRGMLNATRGFMRQADALGRLAPESFQAVVNGVIPQQFAAVIGRTMPGDEQLQRAAIGEFVRSAPENLTQAEYIAREVRRLGLEARENDAQGSLFGDLGEIGETRVLDRARVLDASIKELKADRKLFARLNREAERIEQEGNRIETSRNEARKTASERAIETALRLADEPGAIRDALDAAAGTARQRNLRAAVAEFTDALRSAIEGGDAFRAPRGGDASRAPDAPGAGDTVREIAADTDAEPVAEVPPGLFDDPVAGPGAKAETDVLREELTALDGVDAEILDLPLEDGGPPMRDLLADLDADDEFADQLNLCAPRGAA